MPSEAPGRPGRQRRPQSAQADAAAPVVDPDDPDYRRLRYVRYADDFLLGFAGPRAEAEEIKRAHRRVPARHLKLELSETKTLITHGRTEWRVPRLRVCVLHSTRTHGTLDGATNRQRQSIGLKVPVPSCVASAPATCATENRSTALNLVNDEVFTSSSATQESIGAWSTYYRLAFNLHAQAAEMDHGTIAGQDAGRETAGQRPTGVPTLSRHTVQTDRRAAGGSSVGSRGKEDAAGGHLGDHRSGRHGTPSATCMTRPTARWNSTQRNWWSDSWPIPASCAAHRTSIEVHHVRALKDLKQPGRPRNRLGRSDGGSPSQDAGRLPYVPLAHPCRQPAKRTRPRRSLESRMTGKCHVRFGGGPTEKYLRDVGNSPAAYPTPMTSRSTGSSCSTSGM